MLCNFWNEKKKSSVSLTAISSDLLVKLDKKKQKLLAMLRFPQEHILLFF